MDPLIVVFGFGVGVLVGTTGIGGGSLMTPILILIFGFKPVTAVGTDLAYGAVTKTVGGWRHLRNKTVDMKLSAWIAIGSVPAAIGGVVVLHIAEKAWGKSFDDGLLIAVAGALLLTGFVMLARLLFPNGDRREVESSPLNPRHKITAVALGASVGFVLGVTSAGSGSLIAVGLIMAFKLTPRRVVGTDVFHAAVLLWAAAIAHIIAGNVDYALAGTILLGSIPGVWVGAGLTMRLPVGVMRATLAIVLLAAGLALLEKANVGLAPTAVIGVPVVIAAIAWLLSSFRGRPSAVAVKA
ncbi:MAG: sulfite exporter TauE/SafE family protein [Thermoleophilaceae bacterium]